MPHRHVKVHASPTQLTTSDPASVSKRNIICIHGVSSNLPHTTLVPSPIQLCAALVPCRSPHPGPLSPGPLPCPPHWSALGFLTPHRCACRPPKRSCETHMGCCHWPLGAPSLLPLASLWPLDPSHTGLSSPPHVALALSSCRPCLFLTRLSSCVPATRS